jgi:N-acetylglucosaminyldiphosphoundecaprenol N-acetyl-beta-D-mannosaminyltransferase
VSPDLPAGRPRVDVAGVLVDDLSMEEAIDAIERLVAAGGRAAVVTPNVDHVVRVRADPEFAAIYREAALVLADGMPVVWAARLLGTPLREKVSGSDLFPRLCARAAERGYGVFLLGGQPGAAETAARRLTERHPALRVVGHCCPPPGFEHDPAWSARIVRQVADARPHLLFVALGSPKQERWIRRHLADCQVPVALGVGATIDFEAGVVRRAPGWMQRAGLEWLWRLLMEPRRLWRRYLVEDPKFLWYVARQRWRRRAPAVAGAAARSSQR